jgi:uncharacterized phage protein gp47/JayE
MAGITANGFEAKRQDEIKTDLEDAFRAEISPTINVASASVAGQLIGIFSSAFAKIWELAQATYSAQILDGAEGFNLDNLTALLGVDRIAASPSTVVLTLNLNDSVTVPAGSKVQVDGDESITFETDDPVTNSSGVPANFAVSATATVDGPLRANAGTVTVIIDTVSGWNSATNANDAAPGAFTESDADFLERYKAQIFQIGGATYGAIRSRVLAITGIQQATIFANETDATDANGLPPHSIECVVYDGPTPTVDDDVIAQTIFDAKAAGIGTYGLDTGTAVDDAGDSHAVLFSRTDVLDVYLEIDVTVDPGAFAATGDDAIAEAVATFGDVNYKTGGNVFLSRLNAPIFSVAGVRDVTEIRVGLAPSPTQTTNLVVGNRELADLDTARILVTVTPSTEE